MRLTRSQVEAWARVDLYLLSCSTFLTALGEPFMVSSDAPMRYEWRGDVCNAEARGVSGSGRYGAGFEVHLGTYGRDGFISRTDLRTTVARRTIGPFLYSTEEIAPVRYAAEKKPDGLLWFPIVSDPSCRHIEFAFRPDGEGGWIAASAFGGGYGRPCVPLTGYYRPDPKALAFSERTFEGRASDGGEIQLDLRPFFRQSGAIALQVKAVSYELRIRDGLPNDYRAADVSTTVDLSDDARDLLKPILERDKPARNKSVSAGHWSAILDEILPISPCLEAFFRQYDINPVTLSTKPKPKKKPKGVSGRDST